MLTKKDFIKVTEILNNSRFAYDTDVLKGGRIDVYAIDINDAVEQFIEWFKSNPNFNEDKFREAVLK